MDNGNWVMLALALGISGALGAAISWLLARSRMEAVLAQSQAAAAQVQSDAAVQLATASERVRSLEAEHARKVQALSELETRAEAWRQSLELARSEKAQLETQSGRLPGLERELAALQTQLRDSSQQVAMLNTQLEAERAQTAEKLALLDAARDALSNQFKSLANEILEEKSKRFTEQNQTNIGQLLEPLRNRIQEFQGKVEAVYVQEGKDRSALAEQVRQLMDMNKTLSTEAKNLTNALKGSNKAQGNWGELVLERVLELSGLRKGEEYRVQESHQREDGSRLQPDVVICLPENRYLVVDSKVSLTAYDDCVNAEEETVRAVATKRHLDSVREHIRGLSAKNYQTLYGIASLDFVLLFVPIEPAFMLAVTHDRELFMDAWNKNVLLVSPSTLLFVVRTVAHLWRQEAQSRNAQDIAKRGAELYDKLVGFVDDFTAVGNRLKQAQKEYDTAYGKFATGRGNVIRQAEMLRELGVKPAKILPSDIVDTAAEEPAVLPQAVAHGSTREAGERA